MPAISLLPWIFLMWANFVGFSVVCTSLNEKSRAFLSVLHGILPTNHGVSIWLDAFHRKITDNSWGLTLGKFMLLERTACLALVGAMVTFVTFYAQFNESAQNRTNSTSIGCGG
uniref:Uncharacterized protein n=1 Tax=Plectus sambesii TaxID=2011161 RepID=A0A914X1B0_9BILA